MGRKSLLLLMGAFLICFAIGFVGMQSASLSQLGPRPRPRPVKKSPHVDLVDAKAERPLSVETTTVRPDSVAPTEAPSAIPTAAPSQPPVSMKPVTPNPAHDPNSIFVSIASYRDEECAPTIEDMYFRAYTPKSLYAGIVEQHDLAAGDPKCVQPSIIPHAEGGNCVSEEFCPAQNIRVKRILPKDCKGPTFGRYHGMMMYRGEKYYMMIDSHNRWVSGWDNIVRGMYARLPTKKGVLSHYPEAWNNPKDGQTNQPLDRRPTTTYLCNAKFVEHLGYPRLDGFVVARSEKPRQQPWAAAGFLFADAKLLSEVPFDPYLDYVFDGEEILYSARMWTHGWDIFSPSENILYHYYYRSKAKKFWSLLPPSWTTARDLAQYRIQYLLQTVHKGTKKRHIPDTESRPEVVRNLTTYGLGTARTLEQWYAYAGIDKSAYKLVKNFCQLYS